MTTVVTTNEVSVSAVLRAPFTNVWHFIKLGDFHKFWRALSKCEKVENTSHDTDVYRWTFKDGTSVEVKQDEHSVGFLYSLPFPKPFLVTIVVGWNRLTNEEGEMGNKQNLDHFITYSVITASPELPYSSMTSKIQCWEVTSGALEHTTFVRWTAKFTSDAGIGMSPNCGLAEMLIISDAVLEAERINDQC